MYTPEQLVMYFASVAFFGAIGCWFCERGVFNMIDILTKPFVHEKKIRVKSNQHKKKK